jgi:hypothetical protein
MISSAKAMAVGSIADGEAASDGAVMVQMPPIATMDQDMRLLALMLLLLLTAKPAQAVPDDIPAWQGARWRMTENQLAAVFGDDFKALPGRWDFGSAYADHALFDVDFAGADFTVFFQMNKASGLLQQVLLERRGAAATPAVFETVQSALISAYGPAEGPCTELHPDGRLRRVSWRWRFATTTVQMTWLDFLTTAIIFDDPEGVHDPLVPEAETRRINRRFLPRRLLIRFYPSARHDLEGWQSCQGPG